MKKFGLQGMKPDQNIREPMPWYESNEGEGLTDWLNGKISTAWAAKPLWKHRLTIRIPC